MNKNIIFYFSGTGNCLKLARDIAKSLPNCEIVSMSKYDSNILTSGYDRVGFVYPTYFAGLPIKVNNFILNLNFIENESPYIFAVTSYGGFVGNAIAQVAELLEQKGRRLDYGNKVLMFSNNVALYNMSKNISGINEQSDIDTVPIAEDIKAKKIKTASKSNFLFKLVYNWSVKRAPAMDKYYNVSEECVSCGICREVCPVGNIELIDGKPTFKHHCERCVACIQYCPKQAINYKNITQKRRRYTNPHINYKELNK